MRKLLILGMSVIYALVMTFCAYSPVVSQHLNNEDNYIRMQATVSSAEYREEGYSYLYIKLLDTENYYGFTGVDPDACDDETIESTVVEIKIVPENAMILKDRGFFDEVKSGDTVTLFTTCWIHEDIARHYLAGATLGAKTYLFFNEGMDGMSTATQRLNEIDFNSILTQIQ